MHAAALDLLNFANFVARLYRVVYFRVVVDLSDGTWTSCCKVSPLYHPQFSLEDCLVPTGSCNVHVPADLHLVVTCRSAAVVN